MEDMINLNNVHIYCGIPYLGIKKFKFIESVNNHTVYYVKLYVSVELNLWFERNSICGEQIKIELAPEDGDNVVLWGDIVSVKWENQESQSFVDIHAVSSTIRLNRKKKKHVFQKVGNSWKGFMRQLIDPYNGICFMDEMQMEIPIVQYMESDWELIRRISSQLNLFITVLNTQKDPCIRLGYLNKSQYYEVFSAYSIEKQTSAIEEWYVVCTWQSYFIGDQVKIYDEYFTVFKKR